MAGLPKDFLSFMKDLSKNNNREWFHANKKRYESSVKKPFAELLQTVFDGLNKKKINIPIAPKDAVFRINRDIRFSKDKSPYKTHVAAIISKHGRRNKEYPGNYLHVSHGHISIGGGAYFLEKSPLYSVRQNIMNNPSGFKRLINNKKFVEYFGEIKGDKNKRIPPEFREAAEKQALIFNKQFYYMKEMDPQLALKDDFSDLIIEHCMAGKKMNEFLVDAMGFED